MNPTEQEILAKISQVPNWRHRITLPGGIVTPGSQDPMLNPGYLALPDDLTGKTVLDIGCSDGFFSFESERRGASRVVAVDDYSSVYVDTPEGFGVVRELLGSKVEFIESSLYDLDPDRVGRFDVILFFGVLYHLRYPLHAIDHLARLCSGQIILETELVSPPGLWGKIKRRILGPDNATPSMRFIESTEVNRDPTTWWTPTAKCVEAMLRSAGFCAVSTAVIRRVRGAFCGFTPDVGDDAERLIHAFGDASTAGALTRLLHTEIAAPDVLQRLQQLTIPQFAAIQQDLAEESSRKWHQSRFRKT